MSKGAETFTYDANGNRVAKICDEQETHYSYDALDRLIAVEQNGVTTRYAYDPFNRRLSKTCNDGEEEHFLYQGQEEIGCYSGGELQNCG